MKPQPPCYKCEDRILGCHSTCSRYLYFKMQLADYTNKEKIDRAISDAVWRRRKHDRD